MSKAMTLEGDRTLMRNLRTLGDRVQRKLLRSAVTAASTPVLRAARAKAPKESGLLRKSLGRKLKTYKETKTVVAVVGPRKEVQGEFNGEIRRPARYAHLVEKGHIDADGKHVAAQPFLRPAHDETQGQQLSSLRDKLAAGVAREAAKGAS